jgi:hypothetical protein
MPAVPAHPEESQSNPRLWREVVELLSWELSILSDRKWEDLPELKKKKVVLASRLRGTPAMRAMPEPDPANWRQAKSQITDLEVQSRQKIEGHLQLIDNQLLALQEQHQYWRECLSVSFRNCFESMSSG